MKLKDLENYIEENYLEPLRKCSPLFYWLEKKGIEFDDIDKLISGLEKNVPIEELKKDYVFASPLKTEIAEYGGIKIMVDPLLPPNKIYLIRKLDMENNK